MGREYCQSLINRPSSTLINYQVSFSNTVVLVFLNIYQFHLLQSVSGYSLTMQFITMIGAIALLSTSAIAFPEEMEKRGPVGAFPPHDLPS
jgi:uncharacterized membrane protein